MQETMKRIDNLRLCNEERHYEGDIILHGEVELKNAKLTVSGMLWITDAIGSIKSRISMENSTIEADKVLIDPILEKYHNSKIIGKELHSFDY